MAWCTTFSTSAIGFGKIVCVCPVKELVLACDQDRSDNDDDLDDNGLWSMTFSAILPGNSYK